MKRLHEKASITVFLSLLLVLFIGFIMMMTEHARIFGLRQRLVCATDSAMDVIQLRMREKNPDFSMADCLGAVQVKASMKAAPIFYCFAGSGYEISCEQSRMY